MRFFCSLVVLALIAVCSSGCGDTLSIQCRSHRVDNPEEVKRVAIVDFAGEGGQAYADMLTMHLQRAGYNVVERQYLSDLYKGALQPAKEGDTDATLTERLSKIGRLLNADAVITGDLVNCVAPTYERESENRLRYVGGSCELAVRAFDVRTREVFWTIVINVSATAKNGQQLEVLDFADEACAELAEAFANAQYKDGQRFFRGPEIEAMRGRRAFVRRPG